MQVAYQGIAGAYGEEATIARFGADVDRVGMPSFDAVFTTVSDGSFAFGVVPIENSLAGSVLENYDLLLDHEPLQIVGEVSIPVRHCLLVPPGSSLDSITRCVSHPQALQQCMPYLRKHGIEPVAAYNTAGAARELARSGELETAALASAHAALIYGLDVVATDVQARSDNTTRFFVIARESADEHVHEKASIVFTTVNEPGALLRCLQVFAAHGLNLTKLESRPTAATRWEYYFHVDLEVAGGELTTTVLDELRHGLRNHVTSLRVLGTYSCTRAS